MAGSHSNDYQDGVDTNTTYNDKISAYLTSRVAEPSGFGTLMQSFKADTSREKRMCFSAAVKSEGVENWAGLWMRIDGSGEDDDLGFDNMGNRPIQGTTDWQQYTVVLDVPPESSYISFGILLCGKGKVWLSNVQFEEVGIDIPVTSYCPERPGNLDFSS